MDPSFFPASLPAGMLASQYAIIQAAYYLARPVPIVVHHCASAWIPTPLPDSSPGLTGACQLLLWSHLWGNPWNKVWSLLTSHSPPTQQSQHPQHQPWLPPPKKNSFSVLYVENLAFRSLHPRLSLNSVDPLSLSCSFSSDSTRSFSPYLQIPVPPWGTLPEVFHLNPLVPALFFSNISRYIDT